MTLFSFICNLAATGLLSESMSAPGYVFAFTVLFQNLHLAIHVINNQYGILCHRVSSSYISAFYPV